MAAPKKIALGLGSGGARGYAHIGVIRWIEEQGLEISTIAGSSMGALVGGMYAAGQLDEFTEWATAIRKTDIVSMVDLVFGQPGFVGGDRVMAALQEFVGDRTIEDLPIPYTAVASDVVREKEIWFTKGPLFEAIRASISIPLFFVPVEKNGRELLDGGILEPVPVAPTLDQDVDLIVAVNLAGPADAEWVAAHPIETPEPEERGKMRGLIDRFLDGVERRVVGGDGDQPSMLRVATDVVDAMQGAIGRMKLAAHPPDVEIAMPRNAAQVLEFDRAYELIELGRIAAEEQLGPFLD
ncbi:MAG: patatin-like phospholipase family protein [Planctomycetota bacterium]